MPLSAALTALGSELSQAFLDAATGGESGPSSSVISKLAVDMSNSIMTYYTSALVTTEVTIDGGQPDLFGGSCPVTRPATATGELIEAGGLGKLTSDIESALLTAEKEGAAAVDSDTVISNLAENIAKAVDEYYVSVDVLTEVTIPPGGQSTAAPPPYLPAPPANITSPGTGTGTGITKTAGDDYSTFLKPPVEQAYKTARSSGESAAGVNAVTDKLGDDLSNAFHEYAINQVVVETSVTAPGGQAVVGYQMTAGTAVVPAPPTATSTGTGNGVGSLS